MRHRRNWWLGSLAACALLVALPALALAHNGGAGDGGSHANDIRPFDHVFVIFMENHGTPSIIGDANTPYISSLAKEDAFAANYYGVTHPSLPNYIAATSGNNWYSNSDDPTQVFDHTNLVDSLEAAHLSWKGYMENLPSVGFTGAQSSDGLYVSKHDPFVHYTDILGNPARLQHIVPLTQLTTDLADNHVPNFAWITPNVCDSMHGMGGAACPFSNDAQLKRDGDAFVKDWVHAITTSRAWTGNSVIFLVWDENDFDAANTDIGQWANADGCCDSPILPAGTSFDTPGGVYGGGEAPMIVIGTRTKLHFTTTVPYNHYSMLKTIEESWHLDLLGMTADGAQVHAMRDVFREDR